MGSLLSVQMLRPRFKCQRFRQHNHSYQGYFFQLHLVKIFLDTESYKIEKASFCERGKLLNQACVTSSDQLQTQLPIRRDS